MSDNTMLPCTGLEIAIIGMVGRFPGAGNIDEFWQNLRDGVESVSFFTDQELDAAGVSPATLRDPNYIKARGVLEGMELFDASFFGYSPREAEVIDPQHRIFLECAWEALENAGYDPESYKKPIGVYAGSALSTYLLNLHTNSGVLGSVSGYQIGIGNDKDYLTTRVSYKLNLEGPSLTVQTACSTSLVAIHLSCQGLLSGECDMALAGGVSVGAIQKAGYFYEEGGIASPDGHCRAFDARAKGTIGGNGVGIVVLKRLEDALADGDFIHAVIKGTAINNDGALKVGYTAPRIEGQAAVIRAAHLMAQVDPETISYVEAHGTGTEMGDPIEIAALTRAFHARAEKKGFCAIGSVKTNIGHLDTAAGVAGLIKATLALKHKQIPPSLHFRDPNPKIDFENSPFYVSTGLSEWNANGHPRRAGVSSFGIGGTNAHAVLEEAPPAAPPASSRPSQLLVLSAKTDSALDAMTSNLADHLKRNPDTSLADVAYTLQVGRRAFAHRRFLVCRDRDQAVELLETRDPQFVFTSSSESENRPLVFMFSGQGTQYANMGLGLYQTEPDFREQMDRCSELLKPHLGIDLRDVIYPTDSMTKGAGKQLSQTSITQPALFTVEYALARMWMSWGLRPQAMIGHSIGEYVAACIAGVFSLEDALALVATRGRLMQQLPGGSMLAVSLPERDARALIGQGLSLAAVNGQSLCVISGITEAVDELERKLAQQGLVCTRLRTSHAFHSEMMGPILEPFINEVSEFKLNPPAIAYVSNLTGTWVTDEQATSPGYWAQHLRNTVCFADGLSELLSEPETILLEVGPGQTLTGLAKKHPKKGAGQIVLPSLRQPHARTPDDSLLMNTLGSLWSAGKCVDWKSFHAHARRSRVALPTYPFERRRFWVEGRQVPPETKSDKKSRGGAVSKKPDVSDWFYVPSWKRHVAPVIRKPGGLLDKKSSWLVFLDNRGLGARMVERLRREGLDVVTVEAANSFTRLDECAFAVDPKKSGDYDSLLADLVGIDKTPEAVIHLWGVNEDSPAHSPAESFAASQGLGFHSLILLAQALGRQIITDPIRLHVVTGGAQDVTGQEELKPEKATALGPCRVIPQEYPNISCRSIDITTPEPCSPQEKKLIDRLVAEVAGDSSDTVVAYRGNHRWVQLFDAVRPSADAATPPRLRLGGVYIITGGLGHIGLALAKHLAQAVQAKLILVGRSPFPDKESWEEWLMLQGDDNDVSRKIRTLQVLEDLGAEVLTLSADVTDAWQMREVVARACEQFGALHGVIHAAGVTGKHSVNSIQATGQKEYAEHVRPKVEGLLILEGVLRGRNLDFCLLTSSVASVLGGLGFAAYCASNLYMDAFAHKQSRADTTPWISVNWDSWRFDAAEESPSSVGGTLAELGMTPEEGAEVFRQALMLDNTSQVVISTGELQDRINQWVKLESLRGSDNTDDAGQLTFYPRPDLQSDFVAPRNELEKAIVDIWQELLGVEPISVHDNFFELGGHSLLAIQVISRMRDLLHMDLSVESLFEGATVADLSFAIVKAQAEQFDSQDISDLLEEIMHLSDEDASSMLIGETAHERSSAAIPDGAASMRASD
jgi:acyl transferase domain-containing protein/acyl carrier protein